MARNGIFFPSKPAQPVRDELQSYGFRWAPSEGAWQRHASETAWQLARVIVRRLQPTEETHGST